MGVYLPNMEMPETCKLCYLSEFDPGYYAYVCKPTGIRIDYDMAKIDRPRKICPLVPVPPHGRLIDADELWVEINKICDRRDAGIITDLTCVQQILSALRHAPTSIPFEDEEECSHE